MRERKVPCSFCARRTPNVSAICDAHPNLTGRDQGSFWTTSRPAGPATSRAAVSHLLQPGPPGLDAPRRMSGQSEAGAVGLEHLTAPAENDERNGG